MQFSRPAAVMAAAFPRTMAIDIRWYSIAPSSELPVELVNYGVIRTIHVYKWVSYPLISPSILLIWFAGACEEVKRRNIQSLQFKWKFDQISTSILVRFI